MAAVNFFSQDISFILPKPRKISSWIKGVIKSEGHTLGALNFIFCSDEHLLEINRQYLKHKTYTDIITFDTSEHDSTIEGDIFVSIERVKENALKLKIPFQDEFHRVIIHGVLHLLGYSDKTASQIKEMRKKEDAYLSLR
jgi:probable rRNA maturation factor